jgi:LysM repeat protein
MAALVVTKRTGYHARMTFRPLHFLFAAITFFPLAALAASAQSLDEEYDQVRRIALRDPKVKGAFEKANEQLERKIVEIDPALKGYAKGKAAGETPTNAGRQIRKPFVKTPAGSSKPPSATPGTHTIVTGDTLSTIATHYKVSVASLKAANPGIDEKKLQVGEKLTIPTGSHRVAKAEPKEGSAWEKLKSNF